MAQPVLNYMSREELESLHNASCRVLEKTGVNFPDSEALDIFAAGGCKVDRSKSRVYIPPKVVEDCLKTVPREIHLYARDPNKDIHITDLQRRYPSFGAMMGTTHVLDMKTRTRRPATVQDLVEANTVIDACENIEQLETVIAPQDVPLEVTWQHAFAATFKTTTKHVILTVETPEMTRDVLEMGFAIAGGEKEFRDRPLFSGIVLTVPPLNNDGPCVSSILQLVKYNIPIRVSAGTMGGASVPVTLAGLLAESNAEALSWMVLVQLANPGNPFALGMNPRIMDMRHGTVSLSSPEWALMRACIGDIGRFYNIPSHCFMMVPASKLLDAQAGYEKAMTGLMTALGGVTLALGMIMDSQNQSCPADFLFANELVGAFRRILRGFEVNEENLAVDLIDQVGPGGSYLHTKHTMKHYREHWYPSRLIERRSWQEWHDAGEKDTWQRAVEMVEQILATHKATLLPDAVSAELDRIVANAEKRAGVSSR